MAGQSLPLGGGEPWFSLSQRVSVSRPPSVVFSMDSGSQVGVQSTRISSDGDGPPVMHAGQCHRSRVGFGLHPRWPRQLLGFTLCPPSARKAFRMYLNMSYSLNVNKSLSSSLSDALVLFFEIPSTLYNLPNGTVYVKAVYNSSWPQLNQSTYVPRI